MLELLKKELIPRTSAMFLEKALSEFLILLCVKGYMEI